MSSKGEVTFFRADDGTLYKAVQEHNGVISRLTELVKTAAEDAPGLDETLLSDHGERQSMLGSLVAEIFLRDSFYWFGAFIASFAVASIYEAPPFSTRTFMLLTRMLFLTVFTFYVLILGKRVPIRTLAFSLFLAAVLLTGVLYTAQTGSTLFARASMIQWAMSLGTVLASFRSSARFQKSGAGSGTNTASGTGTSDGNGNTICTLALPEVLAWVTVWGFVAWFVGVMSEPSPLSALVSFSPLLPCVVYRYMWIVYSVVVSRQYRADEATVAWCEFYAEPVRTCYSIVKDFAMRQQSSTALQTPVEPSPAI